MDTTELLATHIDTYKILNMNYRGATDSPEVTAIISRMRMDEIAFSQALKDHLTGIGTAGSGDRNVNDAEEVPLAQLISQFGTARATTLNLLKSIDNDAVWQRTSANGKSIREHVEDLVQSDANQLARLARVVGNS